VTRNFSLPRRGAPLDKLVSALLRNRVNATAGFAALHFSPGRREACTLEFPEIGADLSVPSLAMRPTEERGFWPRS